MKAFYPRHKNVKDLQIIAILQSVDILSGDGAMGEDENLHWATSARRYFSRNENDANPSL